jgi:serine/threonine protein kinase
MRYLKLNFRFIFLYQNMTYDTGSYSDIFKYKNGKQIFICKQILNERYFDDEDKYNNFHHVVNEVEILKKLKHPNIIKYITHEFTENYTFIILEYGGISLYNLYIRNYFENKSHIIDDIIYQIFSGIKYLHDNGIAHLDLSIKNIVMDKYNNIKIIDFGMSLYDDQKLDLNLCSLYFSAPEILLGFYDDKYPSDIWSIGCIWLMLLFNENYLCGKNEKEQLYCIFKLFGSPDNDIYKKSEIWDTSFENHEKLNLYFKNQNLKNIIDRIFTINCKNRINSNECLNHEYFNNSSK